MYTLGLLAWVQQNVENFDPDLWAVPHAFSDCERVEMSKTTHIDEVERLPSDLWDQHPSLIRFATAKGLK